DTEAHVDIESPDGSPSKTVATALGSKATFAGKSIAEGQGSNGKTFKRIGGKRKVD
ncbi:hypothetical protein PIB30_114326, partial [Stylosanthes scabra]|nr:hypothetical protein [Stylosanthes scabra]MED6227517.1 hypothetical protein [Stylosanthes scabra]